jgi:L-fucose mutarotase
MLKNLDPLLGPELLYVLAAMGHGDEVAIVDANFPADSVARRTAYGRLVTVGGASVPEVVRANRCAGWQWTAMWPSCPKSRSRSRTS